MAYQAKPLYLPWNEEEFRADIRVIALTPIQRWMYRTLLQSAFFESTRPYLRNEDAVLWMLAGCENLKQWRAHKAEVVAMFDQVEMDGICLLSQKRLVADWERISNKREALAEAGHNRWIANVEPGLTDVKQGKGREVREREGIEKPVKLSKKLPELCSSILGIRPEPAEWHKDDLKRLDAAYGSAAVVEAFIRWAETQRGLTLKKPLFEFIRVADAWLSGAVAAPHPHLDDVADFVAIMSENAVIFSAEQKNVLNKLLLEDWSREEIGQAFQDFWSRVDDDYLRKFAPKNFIEQAPQLLRLTRKRLEDEARVAEALVADRAQAEQEAQKRLTELEAMDTQEAAEIEAANRIFDEP